MTVISATEIGDATVPRTFSSRPSPSRPEGAPRGTRVRSAAAGDPTRGDLSNEEPAEPVGGPFAVCGKFRQPILTGCSTEKGPEFNEVTRTTKLGDRLFERVTGIEPAWPAWKAGTLPLSYTRTGVPSGRGDLNPRPPAPKAGALPLRHSPVPNMPSDLGFSPPGASGHAERTTVKLPNSFGFQEAKGAKSAVTKASVNDIKALQRDFERLAAGGPPLPPDHRDLPGGVGPAGLLPGAGLHADGDACDQAGARRGVLGELNARTSRRRPSTGSEPSSDRSAMERLVAESGWTVAAQLALGPLRGDRVGAGAR